MTAELGHAPVGLDCQRRRSGAGSLEAESTLRIHDRIGTLGDPSITDEDAPYTRHRLVDGIRDDDSDVQTTWGSFADSSRMSFGNSAAWTVAVKKISAARAKPIDDLFMMALIRYRTR